MDELQKKTANMITYLCTVAPFNIPSLKDKFAQGMAIRAEGEVWW